ncbi:MAG: hypothetical protein WBQ17_01075 [Rhizomicrobium sp.]
MFRYARCAAVFAALFLASCAGQQELPFDNSGAQIKTIAILDPMLDGKPTIRLASSIGQSFGLVGGLIDAGLETNRDDTAYSWMQARGFSANAAFLKYLESDLRARGYAVKIVPSAHSEDDYVKTYPDPATTGADAYLDVVPLGIEWGYMAAGIGSSNPYRPYIALKCRLVRAGTGEVLMQDMVVYNPIVEAKDQIAIAPDPGYAFPDFDSMQADPARAVAGMDGSLHQTADTVAGLLH